MAAIRPATDELLDGIFGRTDFFTHYSYDDDFCIFHVPDHASKPQPNFWTGLCLSELHAILRKIVGHVACTRPTQGRLLKAYGVALLLAWPSIERIWIVDMQN